MTEFLRILILEDNPADAGLTQFELEEAGLVFTSKVVIAEEDFIREIQEFSPDLILSDYDLPKYNGASALAEAKKRCPDTPFILVSGAVTEDRAIEILTRGAKDYVLKHRLGQRLVPAVRRALAEAGEHLARKQAEAELREAHRTLEDRVKIRTAELEAEIAARTKMEHALRESEERYRALFDRMTEGFAIHEIITDEQDTAVDYRFLDINPAFERLTGLKRKDVVGKTLNEVLPGDDPKWLRMYGAVALTGEPVQFENYSPALKRHYEVLAYRPIARQFAVIFMDITERKRSEKELKESEERYRKLAEDMPAYVSTFALDGTLTYVNDALAEMIGMSQNQLVGLSFFNMLTPEDPKVVRERLEKLSPGHPTETHEQLHIGSEGGDRWQQWTNRAFFDDNGQVIRYQAIGMDITDHKTIEMLLRDSKKRYQELSMVDDLTQLYNSRHFHVRLKDEIDRADRYEQPLTLLMLDLDDFKAFNDAYGHVEGDQALLRLGQVIKRCLRQTDSAYRYGGEEFTVLLPMTTSADGAVTAERIRAELKKETFSLDPGQEVHMTVSIGLGQYKPKEEMKAFVHRVDQWMYQGKKNGKDRVCSDLSSNIQ